MRINLSRQKFFRVFLFIISGILLSFRAQYGFFFNDEPFIISLAQRLYYGANLIIDEWNTTQNFGALLLPLYKLYIALTGSTEGIILTFRVIYCIMWTSTCSAMYCILKHKYSGAIVVFFYLLLFSPLDQMTLSYTSVSLSSCLMIAGLYFYHLEVKPIRFYKFTYFYTFLSVIAVLSLPYLAIIYILNLLVIIVIHLIKKTETTRFLIKANLLSCIIAALTAALYLYHFILKGNSIDIILQNLWYILSTDTIANTTFVFTIVSYCRAILTTYFSYIVLIGLSLILLLFPSIKNYPKRKMVLFIIDLIAFLVEIAKMVIWCHEPIFNLQMMPIVFLGMIAFFMLDNKRKHLATFVYFIIYGVLYSFAFYCASDTKIKAIAMGFVLCGVASIVFIAELGNQWKQYFSSAASTAETAMTLHSKECPSRIAAMIVALVFCAQLGLQVLLKVERHYWDTPVYQMNSIISEGAGKGVRTTKPTKSAHEKVEKSLHQLLTNVNTQNKRDIRFLSMVSSPVIYLNADLPASVFSTWTFMEDDILLEKLNLYYSVNPQQQPNVIFFSNSDTLVYDLDINLSDYCCISDDQYSILIAPGFVNTQDP